LSRPKKNKITLVRNTLSEKKALVSLLSEERVERVGLGGQKEAGTKGNRGTERSSQGQENGTGKKENRVVRWRQSDERRCEARTEETGAEREVKTERRNTEGEMQGQKERREGRTDERRNDRSK